ncbi:rod shape-determining protein MreC [Apilactobacillus xinyiensis]|uniref:Cell shape-determining protein MreC n=1 Tax=Apilactobacillus xinyiensis TaxID=2841032 RepID=A0ABT0I1V9_9LACO|nr:rod shape-determining protein MreC [Apilactobacillus xinyiensis]MCK8624694.1 rod shape-determining protein MreC [Apilactobacillus xinyiensis]MCL0312361.1 rod shape-determining protein MreC [Apilactobacillus xinyiensis]MCL0318809.1 rod shape-determining protein MreC [Apilactobacillus xinyiensis]
MNKFFSNRKLVIVVVCIILSFGFMTFSVAVRNNKATPPLIQQFGNDIAGFGTSIIAVPANAIHSGASNIGELFDAYDENQRLKPQVQKVASTLVRNQTLEDENKQLKRQLNVGKTLTDYKIINSAVITRSPSAWEQQIIINKGQSAGVQKNMAVLGGKGLIGRVTEVNKTNSKVGLITNTADSADRFAIQITNKKNQVVNGIITGYSRQKNLIEMGNITNKIKLKPGDKVSTSGLGGVTPKGIYVGTVVKKSSDDYGLSSKIYIKPAADMNNLQVVSVAIRDN